MMQASQRILNMGASPTLAMAAKAAQLKAEGVDVLSLSLGEPDFPTPAHIKQAAKEAIDANYSYYAPVPGYPSLRQAITDKLSRENGLDYSPDQILVSTGGKQALCNVLLAVLNPGDEVLLPTPCWVSYTEMIHLAEARDVQLPCGIETGFKLTANQLRAAITPRTRAILLCSPSNPSGAVYSYDEMVQLMDVLMDYPEILIISDEIYEHINYVGHHISPAHFPMLRERTILVNGVSKAYAMTGWRIGWVAAAPWVIKACQKLQGQYTTCACTIAMKAAEAAYSGPQDCVEEMRQAFLRRRDKVVAWAREIPGWEVLVPDGAFYLFPRVSGLFGRVTPQGKTIASAEDLATYYLEEAHVATVSGAAFFAPDCLRLSYATSDENLEEALRRLRLATEALG